MIAYRSLSAAILCALALGCAGRAPAPAPADSAPTPTAKTTADALIPREVLFGNPDRAGVRLSPDGRFVSWLAPLNGVLNVYVAPAGALDQARPITQDAKRGIRKYEWAFDGAHLLYLQDTEGDENYRVHRVHVESGTTVDLTPFPGARADLAGLSSDVPGAALILINKRDPRLMDLYRVDLATGELTEVLRNEAGYTEFVVDLQLKPRLVQRFTPDGGTEYLKLVGDKAEPFMKVPQEDTLTTHAYGFDGSGKTLYMVDSRGRDTGALFAIDMASGQAKLLGEDAHADVDEVLTHPKTGEVQAWASSYTRREWHFVDPAMRTDFETLAGVARGELYVTSRTLDDRFWIVAFDTDDGPMRVYRYDRENRKADFLFTNRTALEGVTLTRMNPVVIPARDGLPLVSYYTLPRAVDEGGKAKRPVPLVLLVHGGPWARDSWGYHPIHQWLADRGYAVLGVNYRGSTGFGKAFVNAGDREWAGKMHDDLLDATQWAIEQGITTADKVAIFGGSYGGYATLVGLTFTPETFACGVDIVGPSSLATLLNTIPPYWAPLIELFKRRVGDHTTDEGRAFLEAHSPLSKVDAIKRPLLIGQGANDPRVKQSESDQIVKAMQAKGIAVTYVLFPDEGHGFARPENRLAFNAIAEGFLAQCLGGRYEPIGAAFGGSSVQVPAGAEGVPGLSAALPSPAAAPAQAPAVEAK